MKTICTAPLKFKLHDLKIRGNEGNVNIAGLTETWMFDLMIAFRDYINKSSLSQEELKRDPKAIALKKETFPKNSWDKVYEAFESDETLLETSKRKARSIAAALHRWAGPTLKENSYAVPSMDEPFKNTRELIKYFRVTPRDLFAASEVLSDRELAEAVAFNFLLGGRKFSYTHEEVEQFIEDLIDYESLWIEEEKFLVYYKNPRRD